MAKVQGPLLSMGGQGQIGKSMVFGNWKGIQYARRYVIPANPNTTGQQLTRSVFRAADQQWKYLGQLARAPWTAAVKGRPMVARNLLMKEEIPVIRDEADISNWVFSPGNLGGIAPSDVTVANGASSGEIDVTVTAPTPPVGWSVESVIAAAILQRAPDDLPDEQDIEGSGSTSGTAITLTGLTAATEYVVGGWIKWMRDDGLVVYGRSITQTITTT